MRYEQDEIENLICKELTPDLFWEEWSIWWDDFMKKCYFSIDYTSKNERFEEIIQSFRIFLMANNYVDDDEILGDLLDELIIKLNHDWKLHLIEEKLKTIEEEFA